MIDFKITTQSGHRWVVRLVRDVELFVDFYDCQQDSLGQFIRRYPVETILKSKFPTRLFLDKSVKKWTIDEMTMSTINSWLGNALLYGEY